MKPNPLPPSRALTGDERLLLRVSAAGGAHPVGLKGPTQFACARRLAKLGLGLVEDRRFTANERGSAAVTEGE